MPVLSTGTFQVKPYQITSIDGTWQNTGGTPLVIGMGYLATGDSGGNLSGGLASSTVFGTVKLYLDGSASATLLGDIPDGFFVISMNIARGAGIPASSGGDRATISLKAADRWTPGVTGDLAQSWDMTAPMPSVLSLIGLESMGAQIDIAGAPMNGRIDGFFAGGVYGVLAVWWTIPALSACGDIQESHHQLIEGDTDPGAPWVRLDPLNDNAAPVPTVDSVTPNHGPIAGGTALTIDGSGFGDACVVKVDGVTVTPRVVVSQWKITCLAPAHAAGAVTVTVTNEDGVVSV